MDNKKIFAYFVLTMGANKAHKELETKLLLTASDSKTIADNLQVSKRMVDQLRAGERGKRKTTIAQKVKKALAFRSKQNAEFVQFCNQIKINKVIPQ